MQFLLILVCALATVGLYALLSRFAVWLMPKGRTTVALLADGLSLEEILFLCEQARLLCERSASLSPEIVVLTEEEHFAYIPALREEGILVYGRKK